MKEVKEKGTEIPISKLPLKSQVDINGHKFIYEGQQMIKVNGIKSSKYVFDCITVKDYQKLFEFKAPVKFLKFKNGTIILTL